MNKHPELPSLGHALHYFKSNSMPAHEALILFFEIWSQTEFSANISDYRMLYDALKEILPKVAWPQQAFTYWAGKDRLGQNKYQAVVRNYDEFKRRYLCMFGPLFDAHDFIRAYEEGQVENYVKQKMTPAETIASAPELKPTGRPKKDKKVVSDTTLGRSKTGLNSDRLAARLKRDHPEIAARVAKGEFKSIRAAALAAGIVKPMRSIPIDSPDQAIRALLRVFTVTDLAQALGRAA